MTASQQCKNTPRLQNYQMHYVIKNTIEEKIKITQLHSRKCVMYVLNEPKYNNGTNYCTW